MHDQWKNPNRTLFDGSRENPLFPSMHVYIPEEIRGEYWKQNKLENSQIEDPIAYQQQKAEFLASPRGKRFLDCRGETVGTYHGKKIVLIDGAVLRRDLFVDFTMTGEGMRYIFIPD